MQKAASKKITLTLTQPYYPFTFLPLVASNTLQPFLNRYFIALPFSSLLDSEATFTSKSAVVLLSSTYFLPSHFLTSARPEEMG